MISVSSRNRATTGSVLARTRSPNVRTQQKLVRRYATETPTAKLGPTPKKRRGKLRSTLVWSGRALYLAILGGIGYTGYLVYEDRHPEPQVPPDPTKKTLVILGKPPCRPTKPSDMP